MKCLLPYSKIQDYTSYLLPYCRLDIEYRNYTELDGNLPHPQPHSNPGVGMCPPPPPPPPHTHTHTHTHYEKARKPQIDQFHEVKITPKQRKSIDRDHNLTSLIGCWHIPACKIWCHSQHSFSGKYPETPNLPISPSQSAAKRRKINIPWPKSNQSWTWSGYISMPNCRQFI